MPIWSAAVEPRVLAVRAGRATGDKARKFDATMLDARIMRGRYAEHVLVDRDDDVFRFDVIEGTVAAGPVTLRFELHDDERLAVQLATINRFRGSAAAGRRHERLARRVLALQTADARDAGASLREIADMLLGPGDWPGDGEHRKSHVRRMIAAGGRMIRAGPANVLADRPHDA